MEEWFKLSESDRREIITQTSFDHGLPPAAIEKDLWVVMTLKAIFSTPIHQHLVFKGGTSLSKAWGLIERFSEDIDLGIDRSFFGSTGELSRSQVQKLRKASCRFVSEEYPAMLNKTLTEQGVVDFELQVMKFEESDTDPLSLEIRYKSLVERVPYLEPRVLVELSSRSLREPYESRTITSFITQKYPERAFTIKPISIPAVHPVRTFLEKIFLLHEEFQKPEGRKINSQRLTRHLYDLSRLMDVAYVMEALMNPKLYFEIVRHREMLNNISWVDYSNHHPKRIDFLPPSRVIKEWEEDYRSMSETMFYGDKLSFKDLIRKLTVLRDRINSLDWE